MAQAGQKAGSAGTALGQEAHSWCDMEKGQRSPRPTTPRARTSRGTLRLVMRHTDCGERPLAVALLEGASNR
eukprot:2544025-Alexandrium_andersonii.AAC.1